MTANKVFVAFKSERVINWSKLILFTGGAQITIQGIGLLSGILVIRLLPVTEYGLYTLANTMLSTMVVLADGGITTGVMAIGGKTWKDKDKLGSILATGLKLRKQFAIFSLCLAMPILVYFLRQHEASWSVTTLIILSMIPAFVVALSGSILEVPAKLHQDVFSLQKIQVTTSVARLALISLGILLFPLAWIAVMVNGIPQIWTNLRLRKLSSKFAEWTQPSSNEYRNEILKVVRRTLPGSIYYCISGQITIWIISVFGSTEAVAQVGALGRLTMIFGIVGVMLSNLAEPRFSRLPDEPQLLIKRFIQIQALLIFTSICIIIAVYFFPGPITAVLGSKYAGLDKEVFLMTISSCLALVSGSAYKVSSTRGIIPRPIVLIPFLIGVQILFFILVDYSKVQGALLFSIFTYLAAWLFRIIYFFYWMKVKYLKAK